VKKTEYCPTKAHSRLLTNELAHAYADFSREGRLRCWHEKTIFYPARCASRSVGWCAVGDCGSLLSFISFFCGLQVKRSADQTRLVRLVSERASCRAFRALSLRLSCRCASVCALCATRCVRRAVCVKGGGSYSCGVWGGVTYTRYFQLLVMRGHSLLR
jgi:hypothetical protein